MKFKEYEFGGVLRMYNYIIVVMIVTTLVRLVTKFVRLVTKLRTN